MEYEMADEGEAVLFDRSTNPSLEPQRTVFRQLAPRRASQKAERLPEEGLRA